MESQSWRPKESDEFEEESKRKMMRQPEYPPFGPDEREETSLQEWVDGLLKNALADKQTTKAGERHNMEVEDFSVTIA